MPSKVLRTVPREEAPFCGFFAGQATRHSALIHSDVALPAASTAHFALHTGAHDEQRPRDSGLGGRLDEQSCLMWQSRMSSSRRRLRANYMNKGLAFPVIFAWPWHRAPASDYRSSNGVNAR